MYARAFADYEATKRIKTTDNEFIRASTRKYGSSKRNTQHSGPQLNAGRVNDSFLCVLGSRPH